MAGSGEEAVCRVVRTQENELLQTEALRALQALFVHEQNLEEAAANPTVMARVVDVLRRGRVNVETFTEACRAMVIASKWCIMVDQLIALGGPDAAAAAAEGRAMQDCEREALVCLLELVRSCRTLSPKAHAVLTFSDVALQQG